MAYNPKNDDVERDIQRRALLTDDPDQKGKLMRLAEIVGQAEEEVPKNVGSIHFRKLSERERAQAATNQAVEEDRILRR